MPSYCKAAKAQNRPIRFEAIYKIALRSFEAICVYFQPGRSTEGAPPARHYAVFRFKRHPECKNEIFANLSERIHAYRTCRFSRGALRRARRRRDTTPYSGSNGIRSAKMKFLQTCPKGFTLIELVAVIALISLMLFFTMPNFQSAMGDQESKKASRRLMATIQELKEKALAERKLYVLHINLDAGKMWESNEALSEDAVPEKQDQGYEFPEGLKILDVEYPVKGKVSAGVADICFYKEGYSDKALIHIEDEDNEQMTFLVESFLSKIKIYDSYASFED